MQALLSSSQGRSDDSRDHRRPEQRWAGFRSLDVQRDRELFAGLVALDFDYLLGLRFAAGPRTLMDLLPQSVVGRAQNGHGWFSDEYGTALRFPDATFERVLSVLEKSDPNLRPAAVRKRRTSMLHNFGAWLFERLEAPELDLVFADGPLLGVDFLADRTWDTRAFLKGMVLAGHMDDWSFRATSMLQYKRTFGGFPYQIGGGEIMVVDPDRLALLGLGDTGQSVFTDDHLRQLRDLGAIVDDPAGEHRFPDRDQAFFRRRLGDGVCDDMAMVLVGARHGLDAMMGAFVMDAADTYDKYLLEMTWGGYDGWLAGGIQSRILEREGSPLVGDEEILDLIHFAAKRNDPPVPFSSSHRRLIQYEKNATTPTFLNHWRFLQGDPLDDIKLGFNRVPARDFYTAARDRLAAVGINVPVPTYLALRRGR
ncbi:MAG: hypothetical protein GY838_08620 [bacterium]|nr:hypothetical protein [bacterium]